MLIFTSSTACSQISSRDSLCFSKEEASKIIKKIKYSEVQDSIIVNQKLQIINFREIIKNDSEQKVVLNTQLSNKTSENKKNVVKLKLSTTINKFGLPGVFLGGLIVGFLIK